MNFRSDFHASTDNTSTHAEKDKLSLSSKKDQYLLDIQKSKRMGTLQKRRHNLVKNTSNHNVNAITSAEYLRSLLVDLKSNDPHACYTSLLSIRVTSDQDLSFLEGFPEADELISIIIQLCEYKEKSEIQIEAIKIISNISLGESGWSQKLINLGFIELNLRSFEVFPTEIIDALLLTLGNIISESDTARDKLHSMGFPDLLVQYIEQYNSRSGIWAFCNLFRGHPAPSVEFCDKYFPFFTKRISSFETPQDVEISEDCLLTLDELTSEEAMTSYLIKQSSHLICLIHVLASGNLFLIKYALRILGTVLVHIPIDCNQLMVEGLAFKLVELLNIKNTQTMKEVCIFLSAVVCENQPLLDIYMESGIISKLLYIIRTDRIDLIKEAAMIICKASRIASLEQINKLYQLKVLDSAVDMLTNRDSFVVMIALDIIYEFFKQGENCLTDDGDNFYIYEVDSLNGIEQIEKLQGSHSELVEKKVENLLKRFFEVAEY